MFKCNRNKKLLSLAIKMLKNSLNMNLEIKIFKENLVLYIIMELKNKNQTSSNIYDSAMPSNINQPTTTRINTCCHKK